MSESLAKTAPTPALRQDTVETILERWGWLAPTVEVSMAAKRVLQLKDMPMAKIVSELKLMDEAVANRLLKRKAPEDSDIAHLVRSEPMLSRKKEFLVAVLEGRQYFTEIDHGNVRLHPGMQQPDVLSELKAMDAILVQIQGHADVLIFADQEVQLKKFAQAAGAAATGSAVRRVVKNKLRYAAGRREMIQEILAAVAADKQFGLTSKPASSILSKQKLEASPDSVPLARLLSEAIDRRALSISIEPGTDGRIDTRLRFASGSLVTSVGLDTDSYSSARDGLLAAAGVDGKSQVPAKSQILYTAGERQYRLSCNFIPMGHDIAVVPRPMAINIGVHPMSAEPIDFSSIEASLEPSAMAEIEEMMHSSGMLVVNGNLEVQPSLIQWAVCRWMSRHGASRKMVMVAEQPRWFPDGVTVYREPDAHADRAKFWQGLTDSMPHAVVVERMETPEAAHAICRIALSGAFVVMGINQVWALGAAWGFNTWMAMLLSGYAQKIPEELMSVMRRMTISQYGLPMLCQKCSVKSNNLFGTAEGKPGVSGYTQGAGCKDCAGGVHPDTTIPVYLFGPGRTDAVAKLVSERKVSVEDAQLLLKRNREDA